MNTEAPGEDGSEPQTLDGLLRAMSRAHSVALMAEHLTEVCADCFRGNDARGPKKLFQLANGGRCRAELADVLELESTLRRLATESRAELARLKQASVQLPPTGPSAATAPSSPPPDGDRVADAAEFSAGNKSSGATP